MKRWILLVATNFLILSMLGVALAVAQAFFGLDLSGWGGYLVLAALFGFGGAFVSLALSKPIARWTTGAKVVASPATATERWLLDTVARQARDAGIKMPEVAIYPGPELNAFATGPSRNNALVAVSQGLLDTMPPGEIEAVLAHEVSHVANGDMVTMTLLQGTLNTLVLIFARVAGLAIDKLVFRSEGRGLGYFLGYFAAQLVLGLLASLVAMAFSRHREYRADAGAASLEDPGKMIAALRRLGGQAAQAEAALPKAIQAFGISGDFRGWFSSHPPIADRIRALEGRLGA